MPVVHQPRPVLDVRAALGEGPLWDARENVLWWVDIPRGELHRYDPARGSDTVRAFSGPLSAVALRARGGLLLALGATVAVLEPDAAGVAPRPLAQLPMPSPEHRLNDGRCDARGRFWVGSMAEDDPGTSALYRIEPDGADARVVEVLTGVSISNGLDWSPDGSLAYYADSPTGEVAVFAADDFRRVGTLARFTGCVPDGLTVDAEGGIWVALYDGHAVHRYLPDGTLDAVVTVPAAMVTNCTFGGPELNTLYITTASRGLSDAERAEQPHAGALFACEPGVAGRPAHRYAG
ncbi:sugar lactone lactonase YvrE [Streptacidiphilus sp. MAP12-20]|uniref:SMP-30/gluconolactonase/LRE family protein n=1 Tax=Streptacidiphilus sp. MAP12-20 TaxID=3156299 RepID=UPI003515E6E5